MSELPDNIQIVPAGIKDVAEIRALAELTFYQSFSAENTKANMDMYAKTAFSAAQTLSEIEDPGMRLYFAQIDGVNIGYLKLNSEAAQSEPIMHGLEIERIYLRADYQGLRVGEAMLNFAARTGRRLGKQILWLGVWDQNHRAIEFYKRHGFEEFSTHQFMLGTELQTDLLLKQKL